MKKRWGTWRPVAEINITPFTDVILVLLIIFMVATPLIYQSSIQVHLPRSSSGKKIPRAVAVTITAKGEIFLEKKRYVVPADIPDFRADLAALIAGTDDSSVVINGDREVKYDFVVKVIDTSLQAGIRRIVLATEFQKPKAGVAAARLPAGQGDSAKTGRKPKN